MPATDKVTEPSTAGSQTRFPTHERGLARIHSLRVVSFSDYGRLSLEEKRAVFAIQGIDNIESLIKVKQILAECFERGDDLRDFERKIMRAFGPKFAVSPMALEKAFRSNLNRAYTEGLIKTLDEPLIASGFPYLEFSAVHDDRTPATHLALERHGLNGTAIYRRDDPFWRKFTPPLTDLCRCGVSPLTLRHAAQSGVFEAQLWLDTGRPPAVPEWVDLPAKDPRLDLEDEWGEQE